MEPQTSYSDNSKGQSEVTPNINIEAIQENMNTEDKITVDESMNKGVINEQKKEDIKKDKKGQQKGGKDQQANVNQTNPKQNQKYNKNQ